MAVAALVVSLLALLVAAWAAVSTHRMAKDSNVLARIEQERRSGERRRQELEEAAASRASVFMDHEETETADHYVVLSNEGPAVARHVGIEPVAVYGLGTVPRLHIRPGELPVAELRPGARVRFLVPLPYGDNPDVQVRLTWDDGEGHHDERRRVQLF